jgi:iron complex transport system substrate-binding protein
MNKPKPTYWLLMFLSINLISCDFEKPISNSHSSIRLVTLSPHLAELVYSAGAIDYLTGVVSFSDFPNQIKSIEQIGDAFKIDYEKILILNPTHILTWKDGTPVSVINKLKALNFNIIETEINKLADIPKTIKMISEITNTQDYAEKNISLFNKTIKNLKQSKYTNNSLFIETYHQPIYTVSGNHWMSEAVEICGYENVFNDLSQLSAPVTLEAVITKNPQTILTIADQEDLQWLAWKKLDAVINKQIITIHPDYFSRPSMRLLNGITQLCSSNELNS